MADARGQARTPPVITGSFVRRSFLGGSSGSKIHQVQEPENQNLFEKCSKTCFGDLPEGNKSGNFAMSVPEEPRAEGREKCGGLGCWCLMSLRCSYQPTSFTPRFVLGGGGSPGGRRAGARRAGLGLDLATVSECGQCVLVLAKLGSAHRRNSGHTWTRHRPDIDQT